MSAIDDFWNELAIAQMAAGKAPSVITKDMRNSLDGDKEAIEKIKSEIDVSKAITTGLVTRRNEICKGL